MLSPAWTEALPAARARSFSVSVIIQAQQTSEPSGALQHGKKEGRAPQTNKRRALRGQRKFSARDHDLEPGLDPDDVALAAKFFGDGACEARAVFEWRGDARAPACEKFFDPARPLAVGGAGLRGRGKAGRQQKRQGERVRGVHHCRVVRRGIESWRDASPEACVELRAKAWRCPNSGLPLSRWRLPTRHLRNGASPKWHSSHSGTAKIRIAIT